MKMDWQIVKDKLPDSTGWYLVYAPKYKGGSSTGKEFYGGIMISKFTRSKKGNTSWSAEMAVWNKGCVKCWMPLPNKPDIEEDDLNITNDKPGQLKFDF